MISPATILPGFGINRMNESAAVDLPHPDSPTKPTISPGPTSTLRPSTAATMPSWRKNCVLRSLTSSTFSVMFVSAPHSSLARGFKASFNASPTKLKASTEIDRTNPGIKIK